MAKSNLVVLALVVALASVAATASAMQQPVETGAPQTEESIVVVGQRTREAIQAFARQMGAAPRHNNQLARWDRSICPGVAGLRPRYAQFVIDRMAQRALDVGLNVGAPGCRANILIVVSPDADATARDLYAHNRRLMGDIQQRGHVTLGRTALAAFVASDAPVRWWHVSRMVTRDGDVLGDTADNSADRPIGGPRPNTGGAPVVMLGSGNSMLWRTTHQDFGVAFIIVDARQLNGISFEALGDYLAMVTLAQLDPTAQTESYPTILNLFHPQNSERVSVPAAMTDWDIAYLRGLYGATQDARNANQQQGEIAASMTQSLTPH